MNFAAARINMVDSQINTMGVVNEDVLNAFRTVPREIYVPQDKKGIAYSDEDMPVGRSCFLMEPVTHARLLQAAAPKADDRALDIGCGTGYSSAILSSMVERVVAVEPDGELLAMAEANWAGQGLRMVIPHLGPAYEGCPTHGDYSLIILNGSVAEIPPMLLQQLAPHGRLLAVVKSESDKIGRAVMVTKSESGEVSERILFDAAVPYISGMQPRRGFVF